MTIKSQNHMNWLALQFCILQVPATPLVSGESAPFAVSHFVVNDVPHHLYWDQSFSSNSILVWIGTNEEQGWEPTNLKYMEFKCYSEKAKQGPTCV